MATEIANEIWSELKRYINSVDRTEAADGLVALLIDNNFDAADIRSAFKGDQDIRAALQTYLDDDDQDDHDYEDDEYEDD